MSVKPELMTQRETYIAINPVNHILCWQMWNLGVHFDQ